MTPQRSTGKKAAKYGVAIILALVGLASLSIMFPPIRPHSFADAMNRLTDGMLGFAMLVMAIEVALSARDAATTNDYVAFAGVYGALIAGAFFCQASIPHNNSLGYFLGGCFMTLSTGFLVLATVLKRRSV